MIFHNVMQLEKSDWSAYVVLGNFLPMERDNLTMLVAHNIQLLMDHLGTNPAEVARDAGLGPTGIYDILKGRSRSPRLETIVKIAEALGVPVSLLFEERGDDDVKNEILALVAAMPEDERRRALVTIRAWSEMARQKTST